MDAHEIDHLLFLAQMAKSKLRAAASSCGSASSTELWDSFSSSKLISALSTFNTSSASRSLHEAQSALNDLAEALGNTSENLRQVSDFMDLAVDFIYNPSLDILSFLNMGRLNEAAKSCRKAEQQVDQLIFRLEREKSKLTF